MHWVIGPPGWAADRSRASFTYASFLCATTFAHMRACKHARAHFLCKLRYLCILVCMGICILITVLLCDTCAILCDTFILLTVLRYVVCSENWSLKFSSMKHSNYFLQNHSLFILHQNENWNFIPEILEINYYWYLCISKTSQVNYLFCHWVDCVLKFKRLFSFRFPFLYFYKVNSKCQKLLNKWIKKPFSVSEFLECWLISVNRSQILTLLRMLHLVQVIQLQEPDLQDPIGWPIRQLKVRVYAYYGCQDWLHIFLIKWYLEEVHLFCDSVGTLSPSLTEMRCDSKTLVIRGLRYQLLHSSMVNRCPPMFGRLFWIISPIAYFAINNILLRTISSE